MTNRHPVDELADIREEMKRLKAREEEIRSALLSDDADLIGDQNEATIKVSETERVDTKTLKQEFGLERLRPFLKPVRTVAVYVKAREIPEELR